MGLLPALEVDGMTIGQSKRFDFMVSSDIEDARFDAVCEMIRDGMDVYQKKRTFQGTEETFTG
eukprot:16447436-Heterocapsa_arctica.AAC.1